jgi:hypothetical protein
MCAGNLDAAALGGIGALNGKHTGLCDQRQHNQRRHDTYGYHAQCPDELCHQRATVLRAKSFAAKEFRCKSVSLPMTDRKSANHQ